MAYDASLSFIYMNTTRVVFGPGCSRDVKEEVRALGCSRALVVTDSILARERSISSIAARMSETSPYSWSALP